MRCFKKKIIITIIIIIIIAYVPQVKEVGASPAMVLASDMSNTIPDEKVCNCHGSLIFNPNIYQLSLLRNV